MNSVVIASMLAFWAGDFANSYVMAKLKVATKGRFLWMRTIGSTMVGYQWATSQVASDPRIDDLVSHQFPLGEASRALQAAAGLLGREELISVAVTF